MSNLWFGLLLQFVVFFVFGVEMRPAPPGGGPAGEGRADEGAGPAVLPHHADGEAHGAQS